MGLDGGLPPPPLPRQVLLLAQGPSLLDPGRRYSNPPFPRFCLQQYKDGFRVSDGDPRCCYLLCHQEILKTVCQIHGDDVFPKLTCAIERGTLLAFLHGKTRLRFSCVVDVSVQLFTCPLKIRLLSPNLGVSRDDTHVGDGGVQDRAPMVANTCGESECLGEESNQFRLPTRYPALWWVTARGVGAKRRVSASPMEPHINMQVLSTKTAIVPCRSCRIGAQPSSSNVRGGWMD